jgi:S-DNA-T family DNA segregation ATPase FtsK/SpoIIIE
VLDDVITVFATFGRRGLHWQKLAALLAEAHPDVYGDLTPEAISATLRGKGVPSEDVKVDNVNRKGCKLAAVQAAVARRELTA